MKGKSFQVKENLFEKDKIHYKSWIQNSNHKSHLEKITPESLTWKNPIKKEFHLLDISPEKYLRKNEQWGCTKNVLGKNPLEKILNQNFI